MNDSLPISRILNPAMSANSKPSEYHLSVNSASFVLAPTAIPIVNPTLAPEATSAVVTSLSEPQALAVDKCKVWGTDFARLDMPQTLDLTEQIIQRGHPEYFVTANLNYLMLTEQYPRLAEVNARSAAVIADGQPIVSRSRATAKPLPCRVAGSDMIVELARLSAGKGFRMFFLGAAPGVAQAAAAELTRRFPALQVAGCYSPPFRQLTATEHSELMSTIRAARTDILLVAFGQPKGELWIYDNLTELDVPLSIQLGASFDFLAGTARRAPAVWQWLGAEWLYRALSNPRRLGPRYARNLLFLGRRKMADWFERKTVAGKI